MKPTRRNNPNGTVTLWGRVVHEQRLPGGGFLLTLNTGHGVHMPADPWADWWPKQQQERAEFYDEAAGMGNNIGREWWRFTLDNRGQCSTLDAEPDRDESPVASTPAPARATDTLDLFAGF